MLRFEHVGMKYKTLTGYTEALIDVNFDVHDGEFVTILGPWDVVKVRSCL